jgi:transposase
VVEHPVIVKRSHSVQWKREVFDLDQKKLATLKESKGWTNSDLARHFEVSVSTIKVCLYDYDRTGNKKGVRSE